MYGIFTQIWVICGVNVGKYSIHGASGLVLIKRYGCIPIYYIEAYINELIKMVDWLR